MSSLLCMIALLCGCGDAAKKQAPPSTWTTGYWVWGGVSSSITLDKPLDDLFVQVGDIQLGPRYRGVAEWTVQGFWPSGALPSANQYWAVFRFDQQAVPDIATAAMIGKRVKELLADNKRFKIAGVQLDIDSPTGKLAAYATYLAEVRKSLPKGIQLSITGLLDWFRDGTDVDAVIQQVDEFVPQFYDTDKPTGETIAAKVDAAKWGPRFNRFAKRYRVGISTFGRARFVTDHPQPGAGAILYRELTPLDLGSQFSLDARRNDVGEMVLTYRATKTTSIDYNQFQPGDGLQFIIPTPDGVRAATAEAKKMGGYAAGVVYFRWPGGDESLFISADEITGEPKTQAPVVETADGGCVAVKCVDVVLRHAERYAEGAVRYRVHSSEPLEYFLPADRLPARLSAPSEVELLVPPYSGRDRFALGRAVSTNAVTFTVEAVR